MDIHEPTGPIQNAGPEPSGCPPEYIRPAGLAPRQFSQLLGLSGLLQRQTGIRSVSALFLAGLVAPEGLGLARAVLLLLDDEGSLLRGVDAAANGPGPVALETLLRARGLRGSERAAIATLLRPASRRRLAAQARKVLIDLRGAPGILGEVVGQRRVVWVKGRDAVASFGEELAGLAGGEAIAVLPVPGACGPLGVVLVASRREEPETIELAGELAVQAGAALERISLRAELRAEEQMLAAMEEAARTWLSAGRLDEALKRLLGWTVSQAGASAGAVWILERSTDRLKLAVTGGDPSGSRSDWLVRACSGAERAVAERRTLREGENGRSGELLCIPLVAFEEVVGAIAIQLGRSSSAGGGGAADGAGERIAGLLATQVAAAIETARLFEEVGACRRKLEEAERILIEREKLAALGEMSARVAHEIRSPLAAIGGYARRIERGLDEDDPKRSHASIIVKEIARLEAILEEQLQFTVASTPRLQKVNLLHLVQETVALVREEIDSKGIQLIQHGAGGIPEMFIDRDRVKQVLLNILNNAVASTRRGQQIRLQTRASEGWVEIEIANDGERIAGEILDRLFVPFATAREGGHGLGLAVADQIVRDHGGEIRVRSTEEWSVVFTVSLPVRRNQDRRKGPDRRGGRDRRRAA